MTQRHENDTRRHVALPAAMMAILLVSVAVAAVLVARRSGPVDRGAEILRTIRAGGLASYWGSGREVLWYLRRDARGRAVGWHVVSRAPAEGSYVGRKIIVGEIIYVERWQLSQGATAGRYWGSLTTGSAISTSIVLDGGGVTVARTDGSRMATAQGAAPANYIPEGLTELALHLAAAGGEQAVFRMIYNEQAIAGNRVYFSMATVEPVTQRRVRVTYEMLDGDARKTVEFDAEGRIETEEDLDTRHTTRRVSLEEIGKVFPEARRYAQRLFEPNEPETDEAP